MALIHWLKTVSGAFGDGAEWSGGGAPGPGDDAILDAPGSTDYTVSVTSDATVAAIETSANALLDVEADFNATIGTGTGANAGAVRIENGGTLALQGTVENIGTIEIFGTNAPTSIEIGSAGLTLTGGGGVFLNFQGGSQQQIIATAGGAVLDDVDNRISGQGLLGDPQMTIITGSQGFIEAKAGALTINTGDHTIVNNGTIDAEGLPDSYPDPPAQGSVLSPVENNGLIKADGDGSTLTFTSAVSGLGYAIIAGGTLRFNAGFNQPVGFTRSTGVLVLAKSVDYTALVSAFSPLGGEFLDLGDISFIGSGEATFSGSVHTGVLTVTDGVHTASIHLEGNFAGSTFTASSDGDGGTLVTDGLKGVDWLNTTSGAFETASNWAGGIVPGTHNDAILGAAGGASYIVTASAQHSLAGLQISPNARLVLSAAMTINSGSDGGIVAGAISLADGGRLTIGGDFDDTATIGLSAPTGLSELVVVGAATLSGGGEVYMGDKMGSAIVGESMSAALTNDDTIAGAGTIGWGGLTLINGAAGLIFSNLAGKTLIINTGAHTITNAGLLEGAGGGMRVASRFENDGVVRAVTTLTFSRGVVGSGRAVIAGGTLRFLGAFDQGVTFVGAAGMLGLAYSRSYAQTINGFATNGADALDLTDIQFTGANEATFSGNASAGVLTVEDGMHAAHIHLRGDYMGVTFMAASDGEGGTMVTDAAKSRNALHTFVAAMASYASAAAAPVNAPTPVAPILMITARPHHGVQP